MESAASVPRADSEPPAAPAPSVAERTPAGLPMRVRQANLAAPLRDGPPAIRETAPGGNSAGSADKGRSPEQIRAMMGSYQEATERGRREAERSMDAQVPPDAPGGGRDEQVEREER
jgi:hypothetical protein